MDKLPNEQEMGKIIDSYDCSEEYKLILKNIYQLTCLSNDSAKILDRHTKLIDKLFDHIINMNLTISQLRKAVYIVLIIQIILFIPMLALLLI